MIDLEKHLAYWRNGAENDWEFAQELIAGKKRILYGLFFAHLALEKILKAHVCRVTGKIPPRIHNLIRLAELATLSLEDKHLDILADMNEYNIEGRYPDMLMPSPSLEQARKYMKRAEETFKWLKNQLSNL